MNSAEFKTAREAVGLSVSQVAKIANVGERTVRYWESGRNKPPADVSKKIIEIDNQLEEGVKNTILFVKEMKEKHGKIDEINLLRYTNDDELWEKHAEFKGMPVTVHAAYLGRVKRELEKQNVVVNLAYSN